MGFIKDYILRAILIAIWTVLIQGPLVLILVRVQN
ncbi:hypothetical protein SDIMI_v3c04810 [Spiroplasma diminutum CUAS-1]|uniref:Uncharacterized protein n=1 Tax=Spiroplasma diminutum CUAS-1 TaxID=1276221 RepID=S5MJQ7_9MOLU|nr:hypothetical protein SDIMI_v3c04810 [Spiroplasma diminutum CUAS-1]